MKIALITTDKFDDYKLLEMKLNELNVSSIICGNSSSYVLVKRYQENSNFLGKISLAKGKLATRAYNAIKEVETVVVFSNGNGYSNQSRSNLAIRRARKEEKNLLIYPYKATAIKLTQDNGYLKLDFKGDIKKTSFIDGIYLNNTELKFLILNLQEMVDSPSTNKNIESNNLYYSIVKEELIKFIGKYQLNPFNFLTEYDLQSYLYSQIFDSFEKRNIVLDIETTKEDKSIQNFNPSRKIKINPTRREYPADEGFDIAIIDDRQLKTKVSAYWHQALKVAIELKYHRSSMGNSINSRIKGFKLDIDKLSKYATKIDSEKFYGISLLYIQNISEEKEHQIERDLNDEYIKLESLSDALFIKKIDGFIVTHKNIYQIKNIND